uniref:Uncharacterized protein n=1 Tax=viral metagenome TaxID=1070528 RepID=A0A6M3JBD5_9ZZZZ
MTAPRRPAEGSGARDPGGDLSPGERRRLTILVVAVRTRLRSGRSVVLPHRGEDGLLLELSIEARPGMPDRYVVTRWGGAESGRSVASGDVSPERARRAVVSAFVDHAWTVDPEWIRAARDEIATALGEGREYDPLDDLSCRR